MSESRGKVSGLMETNSETQSTESESTAATNRFAELQQLVIQLRSHWLFGSPPESTAARRSCDTFWG